MAKKHFPGRPPDVDCLAEAGFIEENYWKRMGELLKKVLGG